MNYGRSPIVRLMGSPRMLITAIAVIGTTVLSCGSSEVGDKIDLNADEVADRADRDGVIIPSGFDFVEGATYVEFSGKAGWSARYTGPAELADGKAVSEANPSFPPLQTIVCSATPPTGSDASSQPCLQGFFTQLPPAGGPDSVKIRLTGDGDGTQLTVSSLGH